MHSAYSLFIGLRKWRSPVHVKRLVMKIVMLGHVIELPGKKNGSVSQSRAASRDYYFNIHDPSESTPERLCVVDCLSDIVLAGPALLLMTIPVCWQFFVPWHKHVFATEAVFGTWGPMREARWQQWMPDHITATPNPMFGGSKCRGGVEPSTRRRLPGVWSKANPGSGCNRRKEIDPPGEGNSCRYTCRIGPPVCLFPCQPHH